MVHDRERGDGAGKETEAALSGDPTKVEERKTEEVTKRANEAGEREDEGEQEGEGLSSNQDKMRRKEAESVLELLDKVFFVSVHALLSCLVVMIRLYACIARVVSIFAMAERGT